MANGTLGRSTARLLEGRNVTRAGMTRISVLAAIGAAVWFSRADVVGALAGSVFLAAILLCDAVRSQMRADRRDSLALWLAALLGQLREYVVYVGLVLGAVSAGFAGAWGWAAGALIALALRDSLLIARAAPPAAGPPSGSTGGPNPSQGCAEDLLGRLAPRPPERAGGGSPELAGGVLGTQVPSVPRPRTETTPDAHGTLPAAVRRILAFPQPVRFVAIAVATVAGDARVAFVTLVIGCVVAVTGELVDPIGREVRP